jgi:hypothetical protein
MVVAAVATGLPSVAAAEPLRANATDATTDPAEAAGAGALEVKAQDDKPSDSERLSPRADLVMAGFTSINSSSLSVQDYRIKAAAPVARGDHYGIALLVNYAATSIDYSEMGRADHLMLHRFEAMLGGGTSMAMLGNGWSLRGSFGVSHSSDLRDTTWDSVEITSCAMLHYVIDPSNAIVFGVVYTNPNQLFPVLPLLGYVHQREGSPFKLDIFLPHHVRGEWTMSKRLRSALGAEASGDQWTVQLQEGAARQQVMTSREGGALFAEMQLYLNRMVHLEARAGVSVDRYTLPEQAQMGITPPFRAASFAQLSLVVGH